MMKPFQCFMSSSLIGGAEFCKRDLSSSHGPQNLTVTASCGVLCRIILLRPHTASETRLMQVELNQHKLVMSLGGTSSITAEE